MIDISYINDSVPMGILILGIVVSLVVCSISDFLEFGLKRVIEKKGFTDPKFNELMERYRVMGMRGSTYAFAKGVVFAGLFAYSVYAGQASISNLINILLK